VSGETPAEGRLAKKKPITYLREKRAALGRKAQRREGAPWRSERLREGPRKITFYGEHDGVGGKFEGEGDGNTSAGNTEVWGDLPLDVRGEE